MSVEQPTENWKEIEGFPGYEVSDQGRIKSRRKGGTGKNRLTKEWHFLKPNLLPSGYLVVKLWTSNHQKISFYVHRLVLEAFVGPCPEGQESRHVESNERRDNRLANLCWGTRLEQVQDRMRHGSHPQGSKCRQATLDESTVREIRLAYRDGATLGPLARRFRQRKENIFKIVKGLTWKHVLI